MKKYTKLEIELYEKFAKLKFADDDFNRALFGYTLDKSKNKDKTRRKLIDEGQRIRTIIHYAKVPRRFFILNKLKNGK